MSNCHKPVASATSAAGVPFASLSAVIVSLVQRLCDRQHEQRHDKHDEHAVRVSVYTCRRRYLHTPQISGCAGCLCGVTCGDCVLFLQLLLVPLLLLAPVASISRGGKPGARSGALPPLCAFSINFKLVGYPPEGTN